METPDTLHDRYGATELVVGRRVVSSLIVEHDGEARPAGDSLPASGRRFHTTETGAGASYHVYAASLQFEVESAAALLATYEFTPDWGRWETRDRSPYLTLYYDTPDGVLRREQRTIRIADNTAYTDSLAGLVLKGRLPNSGPFILREEVGLCLPFDWREPPPAVLAVGGIAAEHRLNLPADLPPLTLIATCVQDRRKRLCMVGEEIAIHVSYDIVSWPAEPPRVAPPTTYQLGLEVNTHADRSESSTVISGAVFGALLELARIFEQACPVRPIRTTKLEERTTVPAGAP